MSENEKLFGVDGVNVIEPSESREIRERFCELTYPEGFFTTVYDGVVKHPLIQEIVIEGESLNGLNNIGHEDEGVATYLVDHPSHHHLLITVSNMVQDWRPFMQIFVKPWKNSQDIPFTFKNNKRNVLRIETPWDTTYMIDLIDVSNFSGPWWKYLDDIMTQVAGEIEASVEKVVLDQKETLLKIASQF